MNNPAKILVVIAFVLMVAFTLIAAGVFDSEHAIAWLGASFCAFLGSLLVKGDPAA